LSSPEGLPINEIKMDDTRVILRTYLVDDELLALKRLTRLLQVTGCIEIVGSTTSPATALKFLASEKVDLLLLDIQMPGLNGFELLARLPTHPMVIFTTAYDKYALKAFEVNSIDYLLKPVEPRQLDRALKKLALLRDTARSLDMRTHIKSLASKLADQFSSTPAELKDRIHSRVGDRILFINLDEITHFFSEDKLTYAATGVKKYVVDYTITELEQKLGSKGFLRIHRATLINLSFVGEMDRWFGGRMLVRMKDKDRTELTVARDHVRDLKEKLGLL
jgi:two-component system, LytTR family, response regulator